MSDNQTSNARPDAIHVPVLLETCLELLEPAIAGPGAVAVDATLGLGGHTEAMLIKHPALRVVGLDRDPEALAHSRLRLQRFAPRVTFVHAVYDEIPAVLADLDLPAVDGVLFDLGVSSLQLDESERGFSYAHEAPLDMRMNSEDELTAADVVNGYSVKALTRVLREYGEERFALRIAQAIARERVTRPFTSTARLADLVRESIPAATRRTGGHPAKRTFQALRIEVNGELAALDGAIPAALDALRVGGRIVVMSYQSLEDRIVKRHLMAAATSIAPHDIPVVPDELAPWISLLGRGSRTATEAEIEANPRAASVRLRAAEKTRPTPKGHAA